MSKRVIVWLIGFFMAVIGCASAPTYPDSLKQNVIEMEPSEGKTIIYYIRKSSMIGAAILIDVYVNKEKIGSVSNGQFLAIEVDQGIHSITLKKDDKILTALPIMTKNKKKVYTVSGAMLMLELINEEDALKLLRKSDLNKDYKLSSN